MKVSARILLSVGLILAVVGLVVLSRHLSGVGIYLGVSLVALGTGLMLPVIAYLAAGASPDKLGTRMGGWAAAAGFGQTLGSAAGGQLFGVSGQSSFGWLTLALLVMLGFLMARRNLWTSRP